MKLHLHVAAVKGPAEYALVIQVAPTLHFETLL